jgi:ABC-type sugar transport system substrate-binding protein
MRRRMFATVAAAGLLAGGLALAAVAPASAAAQASCDSYSISTSGGYVHYTECNTGSGTTEQGYVEDTDADGQCAYVYTTLNMTSTVRNQAKACPKGTETYFSWSYPGYAPVQVQVYLKEA